MTLEELQAMTDEQLNELAAVKVMGWKDKSSDTAHWLDQNGFRVFVWNPTGDMNDAMEIKQVIRSLNFDDSVRRSFYRHLVELVNVQDNDWFLFIEPRHITIAAILAKESE